VVITKMISNTNARSSNGVMLISLSVTSELRWEKRRMVFRLQVAGYREQATPGQVAQPATCNLKPAI
jgi:hypothetical protein